MKRLTIALLAALTLAGCARHEEISFEGIVVGTRNCTATFSDNNTGFMVKLTSPDTLGATITSTTGEQMDNVIVLYEPPRRIMVEDRIHGTFYLDDKYSKANCTVVWHDFDLPEGVFLDVVVD